MTGWQLVGELITAARADQGLSRRDLARMAGVKVQVLARIEKGSMASEEVVRLVFGALELK
jgi:ribosome-binding protein aMBF1 (putative translation factor)